MIPLTPGDRRWCHRRTTPILGTDHYDVQAVQRADRSLDAVVLRGRPPVPVQSAHFADAEAFEDWFDRLIGALQDVDEQVRWASLYELDEPPGGDAPAEPDEVFDIAVEPEEDEDAQ